MSKGELCFYMELNTIKCMDCLEYLKTLLDDSVDLVVTDPPYNYFSIFLRSGNNKGSNSGADRHCFSL